MLVTSSREPVIVQHQKKWLSTARFRIYTEIEFLHVGKPRRWSTAACPAGPRRAIMRFSSSEIKVLWQFG